jgi:hypothetical protein
LNSQLAGFGLNALLRASIAAFLADVLRHPHDPRYAGKAIAWRNLLIVGSLAHLFPVLHVRHRRRARHLRERWHSYPVWTDNLYLSIFWLDMAGNAFDLYDRFTHFDLLPHFHGTGALTAVLLRVFNWPALGAFGAANGLHGLLEAQEYATDVLSSGVWDSAGDLVAGLLGSAVWGGPARRTRPSHRSWSPESCCGAGHARLPGPRSRSPGPASPWPPHAPPAR